MIIIYTDCLPSRVFFSPTGEVYYQLFPGATDGTTRNHGFPVEDPYTSGSGYIQRDDDVVTYRGFEFHLTTELPQQITVEPFPRIRITRHLFQTVGGSYLYVSQDKYNPTLESLRLFYGDGDVLTEMVIQNRLQYRDGRSIRLQTMLGTLSIPSPYSHWRGEARWDAHPLESDDPSGYIFEEDEQSVRMRPVTEMYLCVAD
jgi:hypothetical protein